MINVTKTYLPPFDEYTTLLKRAWDNAWITNNGELVVALERKLKEYLGTENLLFTSNGTVVLQMALKALKITKEVITTPFSYVATTNAILWEGCHPVFVDIDLKNFCINADKIEDAITENTQAILATHVYGLPCNVEQIQTIAEKYNLKVIYDAAHAFGCIYKGISLLSYGDISTCSFHATKVFHTVEGGCIVSNTELSEKLHIMRSFGHRGDEYYGVGINGKNSEFHAAMGLANLPYIQKNISRRKEIHKLYIERLYGMELEFITIDETTTNFNYSYFPVIFPTEQLLLTVKAFLERHEINTRRYFYPSLNTLQYLSSTNSCPVSEEISKRILCLPMYPQLENKQVKNIASLISNCLKG